MIGDVVLEQPPLRLKHCRHGPFLYFASDAYVGRSLDLYGEYSEGEIALLPRFVQPGQTVLDLGANIGCHTVAMAKIVGAGGTVVAFEPQRIVFQILCANVALNGLMNVHAHCAAIGRQPGRILVPPIDYGRTNNFGGLSLGEWQKGETVPVATVDMLALKECHFIKIDIEGMEGDALAGAAATIARARPLLYVENDRPDKSAALVDQLFMLGYRVYWHTPPLYAPDNFFARGDNVFGPVRSFNVLCIPRERQDITLDLTEVRSSAEPHPALTPPPAR